MNEEDIQKLTDNIKSVETNLSGLQSSFDAITRRLEQSEARLRERDLITSGYLDSKIITGTTSASAGTETTHAHPLGRNPKFVFITSKSNGVVYLTDKDKDNIKVKGSASSLDFTAYLLA